MNFLLRTKEYRREAREKENDFLFK